MPVKIIPIASQYINNTASPIKFGMYSDKFANFMLEFLAEFGNDCNDPDRRTNNVVIEQRWLSRSISSMFLAHNKFYAFAEDDNKQWSKFKDTIFKSQNGEVCMMRANNVKRMNLYTDKEIIKTIANAINKLACISVNYNEVQNKIKLFIGNNKNYRQTYLMEHKGIKYTANVYYRGYYGGKDDFEICWYAHEIDQSVCDIDPKTFRSLNSLNPYDHFDLSDNTYRKPNLNIKFLNTSFTTRDAYLIYLLLTGASKRKLTKEGYTQTEIDEMVGEALNPLECELVKSEYENINKEIDKLNEEFAAEVRALKNKLADNIKTIRDTYELMFKQLNDKFKSQYDDTVDKINKQMSNISGSSVVRLKDFEPVKPVNMSWLNSMLNSTF